MEFSTSYPEILKKLDAIDPILYGKTRNYSDGAVTYLSPYISRGILSTRQIAQHVLLKGYKPYQIEVFLKELAWRDYFQQVWLSMDEKINSDLKQIQPDYKHHGICKAVTNAQTGIEVMDQKILELKKSGYMHNHMRMYLASVICNIGKCHWKVPAQWMYYYLLDADWASNSLSWQWVAGSFSNKKYYANQENINKYFYGNQTNTFLDVPYSDFERMDIPEILNDTEDLKLQTPLPIQIEPIINEKIPTYIYNFYNLDSKWDEPIEANRILLLEPSFFEKYSVCQQTINFILELAKNIPNIQVYVAEFKELSAKTGNSSIHYKEHPTTKHYRGVQHPRDWMFEQVKGYFPSFFAYWKKCEKHLLNNI